MGCCMLLVTENHMGLYKQLDMILGCLCENAVCTYHMFV